MEPRARARAVVAHKVLQALRRQDFRSTVSKTARDGQHVVVPALPDDPMSEFFGQARQAQGPIYIAMMEGEDLSIMEFVPRRSPRHAVVQDDRECLIYPHTHVAMVFNYLRMTRRPLAIVEAPCSVFVELVDDAHELTPLRG